MSMNISQSDLQQLQQMFQGAGNISWSTILGYVNDNGQQPPQGSATLPAEEATGIFTNQPFAGDPTVAQEGLLGEASFPKMGGDQGAQYNQPLIEFANQNDIAPSILKSYTDRFGRLPTSYSELGTYVQQAMNQGRIPGANQATLDLANQWANTDPKQLLTSTLNAKAGQPLAMLSPTLAAQAQYGNSGGAAGGGALTLAAKKQYADEILNAPKGPADAFSYLAKEQSMANPYNPVAQLLGNNVQAVTGQSLSDLSNTPTLSNTQLASDLVNSQNGGSLSPLTSQFLSRSLQPAAYAGGGAGGTDTQESPRSIGPGGAGTTIYGGTHYHSPSGFQGTTGLPTGFQTSLQAYNKLEPEAQAGFLDLQQAAGGQTPTDFNAGLKQGAPEFGKSASGNLAASAL